MLRGSPAQVGLGSTNADNGWNPDQRLKVGWAFSFALRAVTSVASTSINSGAPAETSWSGECGPTAAQTLARTGGRSVGICGQGRDRVRESRVRGDHPEYRRFGVDHCHVRTKVPTQRQRQRQVQNHLDQVMPGPRPQPTCQPRQHADPGRLRTQSRSRAPQQPDLPPSDHLCRPSPADMEPGSLLHLEVLLLRVDLCLSKTHRRQSGARFTLPARCSRELSGSKDGVQGTLAHIVDQREPEVRVRANRTCQGAGTERGSGRNSPPRLRLESG